MMKLTIAQLNYHVGNFESNFDKISKVIETEGELADLILFTELCLSGYYPFDLMTRESFLRDHDLTLLRVLECSKTVSAHIVLGAIAGKTSSHLGYNAVLVIHKGKVVYEYHKQLLPVYNVFDEARHFKVGSKQRLFEMGGHRIGFLLCEDAWGSVEGFYSSNPVEDLAVQKPDLVIVLNASPSNRGKMSQRLEAMQKAVVITNAPLVYTNQVGGNDEIVYDGQSILVNQEGLVYSLAPFKEAVGHCTFSNKRLNAEKGFEVYRDMADVELVFQQIQLGLFDYMAKSGFKGVVVGISGGVDSAITLSLAVQTLGAAQVRGLFMPTRYTSLQSEQDAHALCGALGVELYHYPLEPSFCLALEEFETVFRQKPSELTQQNLQARLRGRILMEYSNHTGFMVLATGNKSELSMGYSTLYGDLTGGFNIIGDLYKTQIYQLCDYYNSVFPNEQIPQSVLMRAPTAELAANQKDSDALPVYNILDPILELYIEGDLMSGAEKEALTRFVDSLDKGLVSSVYRRVDQAEFKRRQAPPVLKLQKRSFGWGRRMPISAFWHR